MSASATTHEESLTPVEQPFDPAPPTIDVSGPGAATSPPLSSSPALVAPSAAAAVSATEPGAVTRRRPDRFEDLLRRCAALSARARVDVISTPGAHSLAELREVIASLFALEAPLDHLAEGHLPSLAVAALEDLRHQLAEHPEPLPVREALQDVDLALSLLRPTPPIARA